MPQRAQNSSFYGKHPWLKTFLGQGVLIWVSREIFFLHLSWDCTGPKIEAWISAPVWWQITRSCQHQTIIKSLTEPIICKTCSDLINQSTGQVAQHNYMSKVCHSRQGNFVVWRGRLHSHPLPKLKETHGIRLQQPAHIGKPHNNPFPVPSLWQQAVNWLHLIEQRWQLLCHLRIVHTVTYLVCQALSCMNHARMTLNSL